MTDEVAPLAGGATRGGGGGGRLARSMVSVTALTAVSRATGFVRVVVVATVVGYGLLGNVYQSANAVPNVVFELVMAGVVQAVLIPSLVVQLDAGDRPRAERLAGSVLGLSTVALGLAALVGAILAPLVARALFAGSPDPAAEAAQVHLGTILLWCFLPQVVCYGAGLVATSALNAQHRFIAATAAPIGNNIVVVAGCAAFWILRDGAPPTLDLRPIEIAVLAGSTTLGVVAFTGIPLIAAHRSGFRLRPNLDHRDPQVRLLGRRGAWSGLFLASTQLLLAAVLVLGNRVAGGVIAYQVGFQFFLLPYALFALPVLTTLFPRLSRSHGTGETARFRSDLGSGVATITYLVALASALLFGLAALTSRVFVFGQTADAGVGLLQDALRGFAPGLLAYSLFLFATRAAYAQEDTRTPAIVNLAAVGVGVLSMIGGSFLADPADQVVVLSASHSLAYLVGALLLLRHLWRGQGIARSEAVRPIVPMLVGGMALAALLVLIVHSLPSTDRAGSLLQLTALSGAGSAFYVIVVRILGGPGPATFLEPLRGDRR